MKKLLVTLLYILVGIAGTHAVPAYPNKIMVVVDGQPTPIYLFGDEYCHWAETEAGYTIVQDSTNHWCYAENDHTGKLVPSAYRVKAITDTKSETFLEGLQLHLRPTIAYSQTIKTARNEQFKRTLKKPVTGERRMLVILMEYEDKAMTKTAADFNRMFNEEGYHEDGAQGSVRDYYKSASYGQLLLTCDVYGPYTAKNKMAYYGRNEGDNKYVNAMELFYEAIDFAAEETDLKQYDGDNDGYIDNVHIVFAGHGEEFGAEADAIWSHESSFKYPIEKQGMKIDRYSCSPELRGNAGRGISRIGVHCHEIGHALGAMDFYDTDKGVGGSYDGTGQWDVMASGNHNNNGITPADFNPYVKAYNYGWISPQALPHGEVRLQPSNESPDSYYILQEYPNGDYYLIENRQRMGWEMGLPGAGLLIYHIHQDIDHAGNNINTTDPQLCYVVCASSIYDVPIGSPDSYGGTSRINSTGCPYPGFSWNTSFSSSSTPAAFWWTGQPCSIELTDIQQQEDNSITLLNQSKGTFINPEEKISTIIFREGFENDLQVASTQQLWQVITSGTEGLTAFEGNYLFLLSAKKEYFQSVEDTIEFVCKIPATGEITISGAYLSNNLRGRSNNIIVKCKPLNGHKDEVYYEIVSANNEIWNTFEFAFTGKDSVQFQIIGTAVPLSNLAIDNIEVSLTTTGTSAKYPTDSSIHTNTIISIYNISGQKILQCAKKDMNRTLCQLPSGLYLVNGKKFVVR